MGDIDNVFREALEAILCKDVEKAEKLLVKAYKMYQDPDVATRALEIWSQVKKIKQEAEGDFWNK